jgi:hypothetical protein
MRVFMKRANQSTYCGIKGYLTPSEREGIMCRLQESTAGALITAMEDITQGTAAARSV